MHVALCQGDLFVDFGKPPKLVSRISYVNLVTVFTFKLVL